MKTYRNPQTGDKKRIDETDAAAVASLEAQGYVEWGAAEIKQKVKDSAQAAKDAAAQLAAAQREVIGRYPVSEAENLMPQPLNPDAKVYTEDDIVAAKAAAKASLEASQASVEGAPAPAPTAPAVPKRNN